MPHSIASGSKICCQSRPAPLTRRDERCCVLVAGLARKGNSVGVRSSLHDQSFRLAKTTKRWTRTRSGRYGGIPIRPRVGMGSKAFWS